MTSTALFIDGDRLLVRLRELGEIGRGEGGLARLAASDTDKLGRDRFVNWLQAAGLTVSVDAVGNIFGLWNPAASDLAPVLMGSHIDTVINAGIYDGCAGVLAGLEVIERLRELGVTPARPLAVAAFTNEEGVRYAPDMLGSLVHVGGLSLSQARATIGIDGRPLGEELDRIGYTGATPPGALRPHCYLELHVEQGPTLAHEGIQIGAVESVQGISWQRIVIHGEANHAGTTPMRLRHDAGAAAARLASFLYDQVTRANAPTVVTVGTLMLEPNLINVIASRASLTIDLRDPDEARLRDVEESIRVYLATLEREHGVRIETETLARFEPVAFDQRIVGVIEAVAARRGLTTKRMTSGAGHDAQMLARRCPAAMIFVPSVGGISHNPAEFTADDDLIAGANVLLETALHLASE